MYIKSALRLFIRFLVENPFSSAWILLLCVCVYIYIHTDIYIHTHIYIYTYIYTRQTFWPSINTFSPMCPSWKYYFKKYSFWSANFWQGNWEYSMEKTVSSINGSGKIGNSHVKEWNWNPISYHHKKKLKCIKDLNIRPGTIKLLEENMGKSLPKSLQWFF